MEPKATATPSSVADAVRRLRAGDAAAAEVLARHALRLSLRTAAAVLRDRDEAADVAQDAAVDVLLSLRKLRDPDAFDAWVHRITVRHTFRRLKRRRRSEGSELPLALLEPEPAATPGHDVEATLARREALLEALSSLPARQRLALALRYVHDLSDADIAAALDCRKGTVHALLSRGRSRLRADAQLAGLVLELKGE